MGPVGVERSTKSSWRVMALTTLSMLEYGCIGMIVAPVEPVVLDETDGFETDTCWGASLEVPPDALNRIHEGIFVGEFVELGRFSYAWNLAAESPDGLVVGANY